MSYDYSHVPENHRAIDKRLSNWVDYVQVKSPSWVSPIWKLGKSNGRQWHEPAHRPACDVLDGMVIEKAVYGLPELHRAAIRWAYVYRNNPTAFCREHGVSKARLFELIHEARIMLINRRV